MSTNHLLNSIIINGLDNALAHYENSQLSADEFCRTLLAESGYYSPAEINQTLREIDNTLNEIHQAYQEIQTYKNNGLSLAVWFRDSLTNLLQPLAQEEQNQVITDLKSVIHRNNNALFQVLTHEENNINNLEHLDAYQFEDIHKNTCANHLTKEMQLNTLLNAVALENMAAASEETPKEYQIVKDYLTAPLDSHHDDEFKKVVITTVEIAKKQSLLNELNDASTTQITAIVDNGITQTKVAYQVGNQKMNTADALEYLIDKTAARVKTVVNHTCQTAGGRIGSSIGASIGGLFGPVGTALGARIGGFIGSKAGKIAANIVNTGVSVIAGAAKVITKTVCYVAEAAWEGIKSITRGFLNLFGF